MAKKWRVRLAFGLGLLVLGVGVLVFSGPPTVPAEAIRTSVTRSEPLMKRAWLLPVAARFGGQLAYQTNGSVCGPASLANVFRSFGRGPTSAEEVLEGSGKCWTGVCFMGLTLDELAELARGKAPAKVEILRDLSLEEFTRHLERSNDKTRRYIINFSRKSIFGAGGGHFSPIGGYLAKEDLVFVLDVNEAFGPWLIERKRLFAAMDTVDGSSGKKRGLLVFSGADAETP